MTAPLAGGMIILPVFRSHEAVTSSIAQPNCWVIEPHLPVIGGARIVEFPPRSCRPAFVGRWFHEYDGSA